MNILKPDSPIMDFLGTVADLIILNLLFILCSLPIVTFGAAYSAKYYVAMKKVRGEDSGTIVPFFKAFKRNFKQSTIVWIIMLIAFSIIGLDWQWIIYNGWGNTPLLYKIGIIAFTIFALLMTITIFPTIARYEMKTTELFKAALIFVIIRFIPLILILALMIGSVIGCLWYAQWFPLIYVFTSTTITYFLCVVFIKQFDKLEKNQAEKLKALKESVEYDPETDAAGNISLAAGKKDVKELEKELDKPVEPEDKSGNKLTRFLRSEKKKLKGLTAKQKALYFAQYYLPGTILIILLIAAIGWYGFDVYKDKMRVLGGGLINCYISDEGRDYATSGFLSWGGYAKNRTAAVLDAEDLNFSSDSEYEGKYLEVALRASILTGTYDYLIMREDAVYNYSTPDYFQDMSQLVNMENFTEDDFYYYVATEEEKSRNSQGISFRDIFNGGDDEDEDRPVPLALKLTDEIEGKLGLDEQYNYYIAFAYSTSSNGNNDYLKFIEYLFGKC
jgi:uncharacterized membrane protein YesL